MMCAHAKRRSCVSSTLRACARILCHLPSRCVVGDPSAICWKDPWHEISHVWTQRVPHENMGSKLRFSTMEIVCFIMNFPHERWVRRMLHWQPFARAPAVLPSQQIRAVISNKTPAWLERCSCSCWPMDDGNGWVREIPNDLAEFVSQIVHNCVVVRAHNRVAFAACKLHIQIQPTQSKHQFFAGPLMCARVKTFNDPSQSRRGIDHFFSNNTVLQYCMVAVGKLLT